MEAIKDIAKTIAYVEIAPTDWAPMVVKHPYTDSGFTVLHSDSSFESVNLLTDLAAARHWRESLITKIEACADVHEWFGMITRSYQLSVFNLIRKHLSLSDFSSLFRYVWINIESVSSNPVFSARQLINCFKKCDPVTLMSDSELKELDALPNEIIIYRGTRTKEKGPGMSWTTNRAIAEWFASRYSLSPGDHGMVYSAVIDKQNVLAYFSDHTEKEVVVDPAQLRDVTEVGRL